MKRRLSIVPMNRLLAAGLAASILPGVTFALAGNGAVQLFPLSDVRLLNGPFKHAQELGRDYLLAHDPDRLLAPFRIDAGLPPKAPKYPNWESSGLDGHTAGHYLTAIAQMWASTGDEEMKRRLDLMVAELAECQRAGGDGYVGGIPDGRKLWSSIAAIKDESEDVNLEGWWVPWYNEHKLFAGLRDAWLIGRNEEAREVLIRLADWCDALVANLSDRQMERMLRVEHGGMNEVLADVYAITRNPKYLALAERFSQRAILDPLLQHTDRLTGYHANTQIPKVIGFERVAELGGDVSWHDASRFFWNTVVNNRSLAFGGNSVREHFHPVDDFSEVLESREGPETCNTYNMLRLSEALFRREPVASYSDYYERALYNHILSSQNPDHGGFVYFTPIRPRHYRVYSQPETCFWCCVGSGMENHGKYGQFIYAHTQDALFVNLFIASELDWRDREIQVRQETQFPDVPGTRLVLSMKTPQRFSLRLRYPSWVAPRALSVRVNGQMQKVDAGPGSYLELQREWRDGDRIDVELPMRTTIERLPDGSDYVAVLHGPIMLAAKTGTEEVEGLIADAGRWSHCAPGVYLPMDQAPMLVGDFEGLAGKIRPVPGKPLAFTAAGLIRPETYRELELIPFFRVHDARCMIYWRTVPENAYEQVVAELEASEREQLALEARTLDRVLPGEQQPEVEHNFKSDRSKSGVVVGRHWRQASGWFSYDLQAKPGAPLELLITYYLRDRGKPMDILVNDTVIASVEAYRDRHDQFKTVAYPVPPELVAAAPNGVLTVKFVAKENQTTPSLYDLRLVRRTE